MFIVFEGPDGCGKTTLAQLTASRLEALGFKTVLTSEPTGSRYGKRLRELLKDSTATPEQLYSLLSPTANNILKISVRCRAIRW